MIKCFGKFLLIIFLGIHFGAAIELMDYADFMDYGYEPRFYYAPQSLYGPSWYTNRYMNYYPGPGVMGSYGNYYTGMQTTYDPATLGMMSPTMMSLMNPYAMGMMNPGMLNAVNPFSMAMHNPYMMGMMSPYSGGMMNSMIPYQMMNQMYANGPFSYNPTLAPMGQTANLPKQVITNEGRKRFKRARKIRNI